MPEGGDSNSYQSDDCPSIPFYATALITVTILAWYYFSDDDRD